MNSTLWFYVSMYTRYNMELGVTNLVQCFKCQKFGYRQTCSLGVMYVKCGVKDHSDAICQRPMCDMNYTTLISLVCPSFCRRVQFTKSKLKRASHSWRLKEVFQLQLKSGNVTYANGPTECQYKEWTPSFNLTQLGWRFVRYGYEVPSCANMRGRLIVLMYRKALYLAAIWMQRISVN